MFSITHLHLPLNTARASIVSIPGLRDLFRREWYSRSVLIFNICVCFFGILLTGYVLYLQLGNYFTGLTTHERFSNEAQNARKIRAKLQKLDKDINYKNPKSSSNSIKTGW